MKQARDFFDRALALDPDNIDARLGSANIDIQEANFLISSDPVTHFAAAEANVTKVLSAAPNNARAHQILGVIEIFTNRPAQGITEAQRALALDPNLAAAHANIGLALGFLGHPDETEAHVQEAFRLSPHDIGAYAWMINVAGAKLNLGAYEEAAAWSRRSIDANPNSALAHFFLAAALAQLGRVDEARVEAKAGLAINPDFTIARLRAVQNDNPVLRAPREKVYDGLRKAGVPDN